MVNIKKVWEWFLQHVVIGIFTFAAAVVFFITYIHTLGVLEPVIGVIVAVAVFLALLAGAWNIFVHLKNFISSIFKRDNSPGL